MDLNFLQPWNHHTTVRSLMGIPQHQNNHFQQHNLFPFFKMAIFCGNLYDMDCCDTLANNYLSDRQSIENYGGTTSPSRWKGKQNKVFYGRWRSNRKLLNEVPEAVSPNKITLRSKHCRSFPGSGMSDWKRHYHFYKKSVMANHELHFREEKTRKKICEW